MAVSFFTTGFIALLSIKYSHASLQDSVPFLQQSIALYLKASPLRPAPLAVAGFLVVDSVVWLYFDRLSGLLAWWFFVVWCLFCQPSLLQCVLARQFLDVSFHTIYLALAAASLQPVTFAHCFKTIGSTRSDGLLGCWVFVVWSLLVIFLCWNVCWLAGFWVLDAENY